jgi:outer membrane lipoprotein carrier protein
VASYTAMHRLAVFALALAASLPLAAQSGSAPEESTHTVLDTWMSGLTSLRVQFTQTVKDEKGAQTEQSSGQLLVLRPGRFRWDSQDGPPDAAASSAATPSADSGQLLVADGRNVWFYDRDLQQVQVKPVDAALSATPIMLLSGGAEVRNSFDVSAAGVKEGLSWVRVKPHGAEADFRQAVLGFADGELRQMILEDKLGRTATLVFTHSHRNAPVTAAEVSFTPPKGVDVIGTPLK